MTRASFISHFTCLQQTEECYRISDFRARHGTWAQASKNLLKEVSNDEFAVQPFINKLTAVIIRFIMQISSVCFGKCYHNKCCFFSLRRYRDKQKENKLSIVFKWKWILQTKTIASRKSKIYQGF